MRKRQFRGATVGTDPRAGYPTLDEFERGRRHFLAQAGALLGAGALLLGPAACGERDRDVGTGDAGTGPRDSAGVPGDRPVAIKDLGPPDTSGGIPDMPATIKDLGRPDQPQAKLDRGPFVSDGLPSQPDARRDQSPPPPPDRGAPPQDIPWGYTDGLPTQPDR